MSDILVKDYMDHQPAAIHADTPITTAVETLLKKSVIGVPVIDDHHRVLGFLSEKDCIKSLMISSYHCETTSRVEDIMRQEVLTVKPEDSIIDLAKMMDDHKPKIYPVVEDNQLVGVITRAHVLAALIKEIATC